MAGRAATASQTSAVIPCFRPSVVIRIGLAKMPHGSDRALGAYEFGIEAARIILGHHSAAITEVYAEKDEQQALEAMAKVG